MLYTSKPDLFFPTFEAVGCYVEYCDTILLLHHRKKAAETTSERWGLPGGRVEQGEFPGQAMWRELYEETGIDSRVIAHVRPLFVCGERTDFIYHVYRLSLADPPTITLSCREHSAYRWVTPQAALGMHLVADQDSCIRLCYPNIV